MAINHQTWYTRHDFSQGHEIGRGGTQPSGYIPGLPNPLYAGASWEWVLDFYEFYSDASSTKSDMAGATGTLYISWANVSGAAETTLAVNIAIAEETVGQGYNRVTITCPAGTIDAATWASASSVTLHLKVVSTTYRWDAYQTLRITDHTGTGTATVSGGTIADNVFIKTATITPTSTGQTTIYTVPTGYQFIALWGEFVLNAITTPATPHTYQWGVSTDTDYLLAPTASDTDAAEEHDHVDFDPALATFAAGEIIQYGVTVAATHATASGQAIIAGYLLAV